MPTEARRREQIIEARITIVLIAALTVLALLGFARIYSVTNSLKETTASLKATQDQLAAEQARACTLRRAGRANTNTHERIPLAAAFNYLSALAIAGSGKQTTPARKAATLEFGHRFEAYARLIQPLPNPNC